MKQLGDFRISSGFPTNAAIAAELGCDDARWDCRADILQAVWAREISRVQPELSLGNGQLSREQIRAFATDIVGRPFRLEAFLGAYFDELAHIEDRGSTSCDLTVFCDDLIAQFSNEGRMWLFRLEFFRHNWKIARTYGDMGLVCAAPFFVAVDPSTPSLQDVGLIYRAFLEASEWEVVDILASLREHGLPPNTANVRFYNFLLYNSPDFVRDPVEPLRYSALDSIFPHFEETIRHFDFSGCVEISGLSARTGLRPTAVQASVHPEKLLRALGRSSRGYSGVELAFKAWAGAGRREGMTQGIAASTYSLIRRAIAAADRIISVRDLKTMFGITNIKIDPFDLETGPIVAYAPGERHLAGDDVSFALRSWVADATHVKGRIHQDRVLTPLSPVQLPEFTGRTLRSLQNTAECRAGGVILRADAVRNLTPIAPPQASRWVRERVRRGLDEMMRANGYVLIGEVYFDKNVWDLRDEKKAGRVEIRERIRAALSSDEPPGELHGAPGLKQRIASEAFAIRTLGA